MIPLPTPSLWNPLTRSDFQHAAVSLCCEVACIQAVAAVESYDVGFLTSGRPKMLFEAHHFSRLTSHVYDKSHPRVSSRRWDKTLYSDGEGEYIRLIEAMNLSNRAALESASWGRFQIMGFNYKFAGFESVWDFVDDMFHSEGAQLDAFVNFLKSARLDKALREKRWVDFAAGYNGSSYRQNNYDIKLRDAYEKFSSRH